MKTLTPLLVMLAFLVYFRAPTVVWDGRNQMGISVQAGTAANLIARNGESCLVRWDNHWTWTDCDNLSLRKPKGFQ